MEKHGCGIYGQSSSSGRSLAGHKRSHVLASSSMAAEEISCSRYHLRDCPTKSRRLNDPSPEKKKKKVLSSSEMSGVKLKQEVEVANEVGDDLWSRGCYEEEGEEMQCQSDSEVTAITTPMRKQRSRLRRIPAISSSSSPMEYDREQVEAALCLMMLSRAGGSSTDSSEKTSKAHPFAPESGFSLDDIALRNQEFKNIKASTLSNDEGHHEFKIPKTSSFSCNSDHGDFCSAKTSLSNQCEFETAMHSSSKRNRYNCKICNKSFHSYQALGGHRASHNKVKGDRPEFINKNLDAGKSSENPGGHECPICGKTFGSGQALGGHKRSHVVAASASGRGNTVYAYRPAQTQIERKALMLKSIDLNLPAIDEDC